MNVFKINIFLLWKLPSAYFCGVRMHSFDGVKAVVRIKHRWINQNPFRSIYFAVQSMAAELSTGALVMYQLQEKKCSASMLVVSNKSNFYKKATGVIKFSCLEGDKIARIISNLTAENPSNTFWLISEGINEKGEVVAQFEFEWSIKLKS